jgi:CubicO group peptidase (beta-lactamase class C family)
VSTEQMVARLIPFSFMRLVPREVLTSESWQAWFDDLAERHHVPGAQVGLLALDPDGHVDLRVGVSGVTSKTTHVDVTPETLFQIGSITKVWTTTLIMQLVEEGLLDLDAHVVDVLPTFTLADGDQGRAVTVRQLLDHTSGIDGDVFTDTGDGDDCVARYVDELRNATSVTRPGGHLSYCNAGFVVAGRIVEVLRGKAWDDVLAERLIDPLGLQHTVTRAKDAPIFRTAVGHLAVAPGSADVRPSTTWMLPRSIGPAGLVCASAADLLTFAAAHLRDGLGLDGTRVLSAAGARAMRTIQVDLTADSTIQRGWGLGWSLVRWGEETAAAHGGGTIGQIADLQIFPERGLALAVLTNSRHGSALIRDVYDRLGAELELSPPKPHVARSARQEDLSPLIGVWESTVTRWTIRSTENGLTLDATSKQDIDGEPDLGPQRIIPAGPGRFLVTQDGLELEVSHVHADGREYLYFGRLLERSGA